MLAAHAIALLASTYTPIDLSSVTLPDASVAYASEAWVSDGPDVYLNSSSGALLWNEVDGARLFPAPPGAVGPVDIEGMAASGWIAGSALMSDGTVHGFVWAPDGSMADLGAATYVTAMNEAGVVVGATSYSPGGSFEVASMWTESRGWEPLVAAGTWCSAFHINDDLEVAITCWVPGGSGIWTPSTGLVAAGGGEAYFVWDSTLFGRYDGTSSWTEAGGWQRIPFDVTVDPCGKLEDVSRDGVISGWLDESCQGLSHRPFVWSLADGHQELGLPFGADYAHPLGRRSSDGLVAGVWVDVDTRTGGALVWKLEENTPAGTNVVVAPGDGVTLTFESIMASGETTVETLPLSGATPPPARHKTGAFFYDIQTTASFAGAIEICVEYDDSGMTAGQEAQVALLHFDGSAWIDVTTSLDAVANRVCGETTSLSPFVTATRANVKKTNVHRR